MTHYIFKYVVHYMFTFDTAKNRAYKLIDMFDWQTINCYLKTTGREDIGLRAFEGADMLQMTSGERCYQK